MTDKLRDEAREIAEEIVKNKSAIDRLPNESSVRRLIEKFTSVSEFYLDLLRESGELRECLTQILNGRECDMATNDKIRAVLGVEE